MVSRRSLIAILAATAGCSAADDQTESDGRSGRGITSLTCHNLTDRSRTVTITVTNTGSDGSEVPLDETTTLDAHDALEFESVLLFDATFRIEVTVKDGPSETAEWTATPGGAHVLVPEDGNVVFADEFA